MIFLHYATDDADGQLTLITDDYVVYAAAELTFFFAMPLFICCRVMISRCRRRLQLRCHFAAFAAAATPLPCQMMPPHKERHFDAASLFEIFRCRRSPAPLPLRCCLQLVYYGRAAHAATPWLLRRRRLFQRYSAIASAFDVSCHIAFIVCLDCLCFAADTPFTPLCCRRCRDAEAANRALFYFADTPRAADAAFATRDERR